mgnify:CR=1 FL=1
MLQRLAKINLSVFAAAGLALAAGPAPAAPEHYSLDTAGAHAFVMFKVSHIGFAWIYGRFNSFSGEFTFDPEDPAAASVTMKVDTASLDTNHAERDRHLRSADFFAVEQFPEAHFASTAYRRTGQEKGVLSGNLTIKGITRPVELTVEELGAGADPWGGYRRAFAARGTINLADFKMADRLGPAVSEAELIISFEGVRQ